MIGQRTEVAAHPAAQWRQLAFLGGIGALTFALTMLLGRNPTYTTLAIAGLATVAIAIYLYRTGRFALWAAGLVGLAVLVDWYRVITIPGYVPVGATLAALTLLGLLFFTQSRERPWIRVPHLALWAAILLITALEIPRGERVTESITYYVQIFVNGGLAYVAGIQVARDVASLRRLFAFLGGFSILIALHAIAQELTGTFLFVTSTWESWLTYKGNYFIAGQTFTRVGSFLINPDSLGVFLATTTPLVLGLCIAGRSRLERLAWLAGTVAMVLALLFTYSNASWAAFGAGMLIFLFLVVRGRVRAYLLGFGCLMALVLVVGFPQRVEALVAHATSPREYALRFAVWHTGLNTILGNPLLGVGLGANSYMAHENLYRVPEQDVLVFHPHNSFLEIGAAAGAPVLLLLLFVYAAAMRRALLAYRRADHRGQVLIGAGIVSVIAFTVNALATNGLTLPPLVVLDWLILGAVSSSGLAGILVRPSGQTAPAAAPVADDQRAAPGVLASSGDSSAHAELPALAASGSASGGEP